MRIARTGRGINSALQFWILPEISKIVRRFVSDYVSLCVYHDRLHIFSVCIFRFFSVNCECSIERSANRVRNVTFRTPNRSSMQAVNLSASCFPHLFVSIVI